MGQYFNQQDFETKAISEVRLLYPDINGAQQAKTTAFILGKATFSGLEMYVPKDDTVSLEVFVTTMSHNVFFT